MTIHVPWHVCNFPSLWFKRRGALFICHKCGKHYRLGIVEMGAGEYVRTWILERVATDVRRAA